MPVRPASPLGQGFPMLAVAAVFGFGAIVFTAMAFRRAGRVAAAMEKAQAKVRQGKAEDAWKAGRRARLRDADPIALRYQRAAAGLGLVGLIAVGVHWYQVWAASNVRIRPRTYVDLSTGATFPVHESPYAFQLKSPQGNEAARAVFYSCGGCVDGAMFIAYYERPPAGDGSPAHRQAIAASYAAGKVGWRVSVDRKEWPTIAPPPDSGLLDARYMLGKIACPEGGDPLKLRVCDEFHP